MASTAEELSSQAEQLQSSIAFFKLDGSMQTESATAGPAPKTTPGKPVPGEPGRNPSISPAPKGRGIDLGQDRKAGGASCDPSDKEFTSY